MTTVTLEKTLETPVLESDNVAAVSAMFGLNLVGSLTNTVIREGRVSIEPGRIVFITGASGSGKSTILKLLKEKLHVAHSIMDLNDQSPPPDRPLVDCFDDTPLHHALQFLTFAGLCDAHAFVRTPASLSDGQFYRFQLARVLHRRPDVIFIDEFCSILDRITAAVLARNVRKLADRFNFAFVLAAGNDDLIDDLRPETVLIKHPGPHCDIYHPHTG